jgi:hypothetical protein
VQYAHVLQWTTYTINYCVSIDSAAESEADGCGCTATRYRYSSVVGNVGLFVLALPSVIIIECRHNTSTTFGITNQIPVGVHQDRSEQHPAPRTIGKVAVDAPPINKVAVGQTQFEAGNQVTAVVVPNHCRNV